MNYGGKIFFSAELVCRPRPPYVGLRKFCYHHRHFSEDQEEHYLKMIRSPEGDWNVKSGGVRQEEKRDNSEILS